MTKLNQRDELVRQSVGIRLAVNRGTQGSGGI